MPLPIEQYGLIGDTQTAALVGSDGSIDWLCVPRFDSGACFAALLGEPRHGRWLIAPATPVRHTQRAYRGNSLVLETEFATDSGRVRLVDFMPIRDSHVDIVRIVEGLSGEVPMRLELIIRFDYGSVVPWVRTVDGVLRAIGGPDALSLWSPVRAVGVGLTTQAEFTVRAGDRVPFLLVWHPSHVAPHKTVDPERAVADTCQWWERWASGCTYEGPYRDAILRSLVTLKALTFAPTGGIIAAPTTSLPEQLGGVRNWDYRYCWLRDATLVLYSLLSGGFTKEAAEWRSWLLRAAAGDPSQLQMMYGVAGERRLTEMEIDWLPGYEGARPVRIGNAAVRQLQLDVYGELMDALHVSRRAGVEVDAAAWALQLAVLKFLEGSWTEPDEGIWEVRGPRRHFTHSKVMAWVAFDRAIRTAETFHLDGPVDRWRSIRAEIHGQVCRDGFDAERNSFVQFLGGTALDASLLLMPAVGFLAPDDPRIVGTVRAIERELLHDGLVRRYVMSDESEAVDGLPPGEGVFLACTFWLIDAYVLLGQRDAASRLFDRLLALRNDLGLLSEQYDPGARRLVGNFPQAFSHVSLVNTALNLSHMRGPAEDRRRSDEPRLSFTNHECPT